MWLSLKLKKAAVHLAMTMIKPLVPRSKHRALDGAYPHGAILSQVSEEVALPLEDPASSPRDVFPHAYFYQAPTY